MCEAQSTSGAMKQECKTTKMKNKHQVTMTKGMMKGYGSAGRQWRDKMIGDDQWWCQATVGDGGSPGTLNRNEWAVLKGAGGAGSTRDEPATPTGYISITALGWMSTSLSTNTSEKGQ